MTILKKWESRREKITSAKVSTRNKRLPLDCTSWEIHFVSVYLLPYRRCEDNDEYNRFGNALLAWIAAFKSISFLNFVEFVKESTPISRTRRKTVEAAIRFNQSLNWTMKNQISKLSRTIRFSDAHRKEIQIEKQSGSKISEIQWD